jgi:hypothetical protein
MRMTTTMRTMTTMMTTGGSSENSSHQSRACAMTTLMAPWSPAARMRADDDRGSTRKNVIFSNSLWTNSEYPNSLKSMSIWSLSLKKNDPFLTYEHLKVSVFCH